MFSSILTKVFGSRNDRTLKKLNKITEQVNQLEAEYEALSDEQLKAKTGEFQTRLKDGEDTDNLLPEAFAVVREASKRVITVAIFPFLVFLILQFQLRDNGIDLAVKL